MGFLLVLVGDGLHSAGSLAMAWEVGSSGMSPCTIIKSTDIKSTDHDDDFASGRGGGSKWKQEWLAAKAREHKGRFTVVHVVEESDGTCISWTVDIEDSCLLVCVWGACIVLLVGFLPCSPSNPLPAPRVPPSILLNRLHQRAAHRPALPPGGGQRAGGGHGAGLWAPAFHGGGLVGWLVG